MSSRTRHRLRIMTTFALIHGAGDGGWAWHLVQSELRARGHEAVAPDLPTDDPDATWDDCVRTVVDAVAGADDVVVVGHSAGGLVVPLVADRLGAALQVFVAGMVPRPGETARNWFANVGWTAPQTDAAPVDSDTALGQDEAAIFYHDVSPSLATEAMTRAREEAAHLGDVGWPLPRLPEVPARYIVTTRDRFISPAVQHRVAAERLGIVSPDSVDAGHCANLSRPVELASLLDSYAQPGPTR